MDENTTMKKAYVLYKTQWDSFEIIGVYEDQEGAETRKKLEIENDKILIFKVKEINDKYDQKIKELKDNKYSLDEFYWSDTSKIEDERHEELIKVNADWVEYTFGWNYYIKEFELVV